MIAIIDYGLGNIKSIKNALERINEDAVLTDKTGEILNSKGIILPGVGAFNAAMQKLRDSDLAETLTEAKNRSIPILGICLGMQLLFERSFEEGETEGLGLLKGDVAKIETTEKLPHIGWNNLHFDKTSPYSFAENQDVYFVHSYQAPFNEYTDAYCEYGDVKIPAIVSDKNVLGFQFHPEKSSDVGEQMLRVWAGNL